MYSLKSPIVVTWIATKKCNLNCLHCSTTAVESSYEMTTSEAKRMIDDLALNEVFVFVISGGEPFLRKDVFDLISYAKTSMKVIVQTNGMFLKKFAKKIVAAGTDALQISLDGSTAPIHDAIRNKKGVFEKVIEGIKEVHKHRIPFIINSVITKINLDDLPSIIDLAYDLGAHSYRTTKLVPIGNAEKNLEQLHLSYANALKVHQILVQKREEYRGEYDFVTDLSFTCADTPSNVVEYGCAAGQHRIEILQNGDVIPCAYLCSSEFVVGNIFNESLCTIWAKSELFKTLRNLAVPKGCQKCSRLEYCRGGCRSYALYLGNNIQGPDPLACYIHRKELKS